MRKIVTLLTAAAFLGVSSAAIAAAPTATPSPSQVCKDQRTQMGTATFKATYGTNKNRSNALGKCVSKATKQQATEQANAKSTCKTEQSDPNFAAGHDGKTFAQFYGTNKNGRNAFGKCVSSHARTAAKAHTDAVVSAAEQCRTERKADPAAFSAKYGTNKNGRNAFGKCVSKTAAAQQDQQGG